MKVLLTGASGLIGTTILRLLQNQGIDTVVIGRARPLDYQGEFIAADLLELAATPALIANAGATHLMHLAWYVEHGLYWTSPLNLRWVDASVRLVEMFRDAGGQKVLAAGSCAEYEWSWGVCREDFTPLIPATLYGVAKDACRRLLGSLCRESDMPFAWGRIFLPYGPNEDSRRLVPGLKEVFQGKRAPFPVNQTAYRDFLHTEDVARGFIRLLFSQAEGAYNVCSGQPVQIAEVVRLIAAQCGADPGIVLDLEKTGSTEPEILVGDSGKLRSLGWSPAYGIEGILAKGTRDAND
jgi:nucleoside-diphosphate-sugar epimerase